MVACLHWILENIKNKWVTVYLDCAHNGCRRYVLRLTYQNKTLPNYVDDKFTIKSFPSNDPIKHEEGQKRRPIKEAERIALTNLT